MNLDDLLTTEVEIPEPVGEPATYSLGDFPKAIDNTMRSMFSQCEGKFAYAQLAGIGSPRKSVHLEAGGAFASGIEHARKAFYVDGKPESESVGIGAEALIKAWGTYEAPDDATKTLDRMLGALDFYFSVFPMSQDYVSPYVDKDGKMGIEFSFAVPLPIAHPQTGDPVLYCGRFDMLGLHKNGSVLAVDEKTASQLGATWSRNWNMDSQFTGYVAGARSYNVPVAGAVIRGISILKTKYDSAEALIYRSDWEIQRWYQQLLRDVRGMVRIWSEIKALEEAGLTWHDRADINWSLDKNACNSYGGCTFERLCLQRDPRDLIPIEYVKHFWDPQKRDEQ